MARGMLTDEVKKVSVEQLGYEIDTEELRVMPYAQFCLMNSQPINRGQITRSENRILNKWQEKGFVNIDSNIEGRRLFVTKKFYRAMMEILLVAYCSDWILDK